MWKRLGLLCFLVTLVVPPVVARAELIAHFKFDGNATDSVGSHSGTAVNGPTYTSGIVGQCLRLDGVDDYVSIPNNPAWNQNDWTIALWVRTDTPGQLGVSGTAYRTGRGLVDADIPGQANRSWSLTYHGGRIRAGTNSGGAEVAVEMPTPTMTITDRTWHHIAWTRDSITGTLWLYIDGALVSTGTNSIWAGFKTGRTDIRVGSQNNNAGEYFSGEVDDLRFYNNVLTVDEVRGVVATQCAQLLAPPIGAALLAPVTMSWQAGVASPSTVVKYYLFLDPNVVLLRDPNRRDAGGTRMLEDVQVLPNPGNPLGPVSYVWNGPVVYDVTYYWLVDSLIRAPVSPTDPNVIERWVEGNTWSFKGPATTPTLTGPADAYVLPDPNTHRYPASPSATLTVNIDPSIFTVYDVYWYKEPSVVALTNGAKYTIAWTNTQTTLTINSFDVVPPLDDNGMFYCRVRLNVDGVPRDPRDSAHAFAGARYGLKHRYSFSEVAGTTVADSISAKTGTIKSKLVGGTYAWGGGQLTLNNESVAVGPNDNDPNGAYVDLPNGMISALRENATFMLWYTWQDPNAGDSTSDYQRVWDFGSSAPTGGENQTGAAAYCVFVRLATRNNAMPGAIQFQSGKSNSFANLDDGNYVVNNQVCVAVVLDSVANEWRMYVNGVQSPTTAVAPNQTLATLNDLNNWIGRCQQNNRGFYTGKLNEFRIYDIPLTKEWIKAAYDEGPDDIDLNPCIYPPVYQVNGDCVLDLRELKAFLQGWLDCGLLDCD